MFSWYLGTAVPSNFRGPPVFLPEFWWCRWRILTTFFLSNHFCQRFSSLLQIFKSNLRPNCSYEIFHWVPFLLSSKFDQIFRLVKPNSEFICVRIQFSRPFPIPSWDVQSVWTPTTEPLSVLNISFMLEIIWLIQKMDRFCRNSAHPSFRSFHWPCKDCKFSRFDYKKTATTPTFCKRNFS